MQDEKTRKKKKKRPGPLRRQREGRHILYFWHGMGLLTWLRLLARGRFAVTLNCLPGILTVSLMAPLNSLLYLASEAVYGRRVSRQAITPAPVFIIGCWRTGTTFLHELLARDPKLACPTTYECFFPTHFLLTERAAARWFDYLLPTKRPMDNMRLGMDRPQEDEFAYLNLGMGTPYVTIAWPRHGPRDLDYLDFEGLSEAARRRWERGFLWFLRRLSFKHGKRLVLKSPAHTARVETLLRLFPDARFVHLTRHPLALYPSALKTWRALNSVQGLHNPARDEAWVEDMVFAVLNRLYRAFETQKALIPEGHLVEIAFEDLVAAPKRAVKQVYNRLGLGDFAAVAPGIDEYLARRADYQRNQFEMPDDLRRTILNRWGDYARRYGYSDAAP